MRKRIIAMVLGASFISAGGIMFIKDKEGTVYTSYPDPGTGGAPWTICNGHTTGVKPGMTATKAQCDKWLKEDLLVAEKVVQRLVKVPISQNEYDVYTSFVFNAGETNFKNSTMLKLLNNNQHYDACHQFVRWIYADKRVLNGLKKRRSEEMTTCLKPSEIWYVPIKRVK